MLVESDITQGPGQLNGFRLPDMPAEVLLLTKLTCLCCSDGLETMSRNLSPLKNLVELNLPTAVSAAFQTCYQPAEA